MATQTNQWPALADIASSVRNGESSAASLVKKSLEIISGSTDYDAIISTTEERALERARAIDEAVKNGEQLGALAGVPFIAKDNFLTFGGETTAASNILRGFNAPYQSTAIERLEQAGAICVAKANLDAFAHGSSTENSDFMTTKNPRDKSRVPGGSSGGSAAAVVLGMAPFALGTDTGGSIRLPASFCGAVGYKPTYGLVSRSGVVAMASSTDVIGPITRTVADSALILDVMSGVDPLDSTTIEKDVQGYTDLGFDLKGKKVGIVKEYTGDGITAGVQKQVDEAKKKLVAAGAELVEISLPMTKLALGAYYIIMPAEVSSNLGRYDGQRYGYSTEDAKNLDESFSESRGKGFGKEAKRRIMMGTYVLSSGYFDAYYKKAQTVRTKLINECEEAFKKVDFLLGPTTGAVAFKIGEVQDPLQMYMTDAITVTANLAGIPAISIPAGESEGLPVGINIMAASGQDRALLGFARATAELLA